MDVQTFMQLRATGFFEPSGVLCNLLGEYGREGEWENNGIVPAAKEAGAAACRLLLVICFMTSGGVNGAK